MISLARTPPAVRYPLWRSRALGWGLLAALALAALVLLAGVLSGAGAMRGVFAAVAAALWLVAGAGALHFWWRQPRGWLCWNGHAWTLAERPGGPAVALESPPEVALDLQSHLWLRLKPMARPCAWAWLERSHEPGRWLDLRRAVYSRARPGAANADTSAPAAAVGRES